MFFKSKYGKLLVSSVVCVLLLISLNLSVFADSVGTFKFADLDFEALVAQGDGTSAITVTNDMSVSYGRAGFSTMLDRYVSTFRFPSQYNSYNKILMLSIPLSFTVGKEYNISFDYTANYSSSSSFNFLVQVCASSDNSVLDSVELYNGSVGSGYQVNSVNVNFTIPYYTQAFYCLFYCQVTSRGSNSASVGQAFFFTDMVITSNALDDYGSFTPPDSDLSQATDDMNNLSSDIAELDNYKIDKDQLEALMHVSMSDYDNGLTAAKTVVEDVLDATAMLPVLTFILAFGLGVYILGRRLA